MEIINRDEIDEKTLFEKLAKKFVKNTRYDSDMRPCVVFLDTNNKPQQWNDLSWYIKRKIINNYLTKNNKELLPYDIRDFIFTNINYDAKNRKIISIDISKKN
jgi:hypothetical protein